MTVEEGACSEFLSGTLGHMRAACAHARFPKGIKRFLQALPEAGLPSCSFRPVTQPLRADCIVGLLLGAPSNPSRVHLIAPAP